MLIQRETLTNSERPNRAEMEACPDQEVEGWAGAVGEDKDPLWFGDQGEERGTLNWERHLPF